MKRTAAELQFHPLMVSLPAYRIAQLRRLAERTNADHLARYGTAYEIGPDAVAAAILIQALDRIAAEEVSDL